MRALKYLEFKGHPDLTVPFDIFTEREIDIIEKAPQTGKFLTMEDWQGILTRRDGFFDWSQYEWCGLAISKKEHAEWLAKVEERGLDFDSMYTIHNLLQAVIGWGILSDEYLNTIVEQGGDWIEVGAGSGYYSAVLQAKGLNIIPTDFNGNEGDWRYMHTDVVRMDVRTAVEMYPGYSILCSWPYPDMADEIAELVVPGQKLAVVGPLYASLSENLSAILANDTDKVISYIPSVDGNLSGQRAKDVEPAKIFTYLGERTLDECLKMNAREGTAKDNISFDDYNDLVCQRVLRAF